MTANSKPRQVDRVLAALRAHPSGVNETRFAAPNVLDGQKPIQRVAARVFELRQEGHDIETRRESNGTATYTLRSDVMRVELDAPDRPDCRGRVMYGHASWLAQAHAGYRLLDDDYRPAAREEYADDPEPCDGSGEIRFNRSPGREPWNDDSVPCHGCENCEPDDDENDRTNGQEQGR